MPSTLIIRVRRSSLSTLASGDAGPIHTGVEKSFRHPCRRFYYKYQTFSTDVELVRQNWIVSKATSPGREPRYSDLLSDALPLRHTLFLIKEYIVLVIHF